MANFSAAAKGVVRPLFQKNGPFQKRNPPQGTDCRQEHFNDFSKYESVEFKSENAKRIWRSNQRRTAWLSDLLPMGKIMKARTESTTKLKRTRSTARLLCRSSQRDAVKGGLIQARHTLTNDPANASSTAVLLTPVRRKLHCGTSVSG